MPTNFPTGIDNFNNPTSGDNLDSPLVIHHVQHTNENDAISAIEKKLGINFSPVSGTIDTAVNLFFLVETQHTFGGYREITPFGNPFPTLVRWYTDSGKTITLVDKVYTYDTRKRITKIVYTLYDGTVGNVVKRIITDTPSYAGNSPFEITRTRVVT